MSYYFLEAEVLFRITPKTEHPVDLYFIMDLSNSMQKYKESLERTAKSVKESIEKETTKFRMGFGSFSDKPTAPFSGKFGISLHAVLCFHSSQKMFLKHLVLYIFSLVHCNVKITFLIFW